jgi:ATP-dependent exoDNAse (exonuclease V) beta subunit
MNKNIKVVKASAGTGKTYRLALEYISRILLGEDYNEILFMTFTRAATAELKVRIFEFLEELSNGSDELEGNIKKLYSEIEIDRDHIKAIRNELLQNKDRIRIYTIDSFIGQIFKKAIGPSLNIYSYSTVNNVEAEVIYQEVFTKIIEGDSFHKIENFLKKTADREVEKYIELIKTISQDRWKFFLIKEKKEEEEVEGVKQQLYREIVELFATLNELAKEPKKVFEKLLGKSGKLIYGEFGSDLSDSEEVTKFILENNKFLMTEKYYNGQQTRGDKLANFKERFEESQEKILELIKKIIFIEEVLPYEKDIIEIEKITRTIYDEIKFREKKFTFSDITNYTSEYILKEELDLVKDGVVTENFYEIIGGKITTLFLDEAQDTSVSQWRVIEPIAKACKNIIIVGDEKQSIYSWRGGEKGLFLSFHKILNGGIDTLPMNFRSEKKIIDFVNLFFDSVSRNQVTQVEGLNWEYNEVICSKKEDKGFVAVMVDLETPNAIAEDIEERFANRNLDGTPDYRGIGIVARGKKDLNEVGNCLKERKIPYIMSNTLSIVVHPCVEEVMRLFNYFIHNDFMTLLEFFRTTLGIGEEALKYMLKERNKIMNYMSFVETPLQEAEIDGKIEKSIKDELDKIIELRKLDYKKLGVVVVSRYDFSNKYKASRDIKNINYFLELMEGCYDLAEFMKFLKDSSEDLKQKGLAELNSVILMTIHGSKGLDFHTEYMFLKDGSRSYDLMGMVDGIKKHKVNLLTKLDENYEYIEDYLFTNSMYSKAIKETSIYRYSEQIYLDEVLNTLYVGMTRPKANLIISIQPTKPRSNAKDQTPSLSNELLIKPIEKFFDVTAEELINGATQTVGQFIPYDSNQGKNDEDKDGVEELILEPRIYHEVLELKNQGMENNSPFDSAQGTTQGIDLNVKNELKRKTGLAIHYYLENIEYGSVEEMKIAKQLTLNKYSNMLGIDRTKDIILRVEKFISENKEVFDERFTVFKELELITYELDGEERIKKTHIIDRLNLDEKNKEIAIYDYKSGSSMDQEQLDRYKRVVGEKVGEDYNIKTKFLKLS